MRTSPSRPLVFAVGAIHDMLAANTLAAAWAEHEEQERARRIEHARRRLYGLRGTQPLRRSLLNELDAADGDL